jgi:hypothetical protein
MMDPVLTPIQGGWAALHDVPGDRWAVHAPTKEAALRKFEETKRRYREIDTEAELPRIRSDAGE